MTKEEIMRQRNLAVPGALWNSAAVLALLDSLDEAEAERDTALAKLGEIEKWFRSHRYLFDDATLILSHFFPAKGCNPAECDTPSICPNCPNPGENK